jgi:uncharacterized protein YhdP
MPYSASYQVLDGDAYEFEMNSTMQGTAVALPAPLGKTAKSEWPTRLVVRGDGNGKTADQVSLTLAKVLALNARTNLKPSKTSPAMLDAVSIGIGTPPPNLRPGMVLAMRLNTANAKDWSPVADVLQAEMAAPSVGQPLLPGLVTASLTAKQLQLDDTLLDNLQATLGVTAADQYNLSVSSDQTQGSVVWREQDGKLDGRINAHFTKLNLGRMP